MKRLILILALTLSLIFTFASCSADAPTIKISEDGYWVINGEKTDVLAEGTQGPAGEQGEPGKDGAGAVDENPLGLAFFLNGFLPLIEENDNREIVVMNVIAGIITTIVSIFGLFVAVDTITTFLYLLLLLLGLTNLYIAAVCIWDLSEQSLGWFSAMLALITLAVGIYLLLTGNVILGFAYLVLMFIWLAYFLSRGLDVLQTTSSWVIMLEGVIALVVVGLLILTGILVIL